MSHLLRTAADRLHAAEVPNVRLPPRKPATRDAEQADCPAQKTAVPGRDYPVLIGFQDSGGIVARIQPLGRRRIHR
jgi:hypothetical protein